MNEHWQPFSLLCQPCIVSYNFIGVYESLEDEANYVLERSGTSARWPPQQAFYKPMADEEVKKLYKSLDSNMIKSLVQKYHLDFSLFGYDPEEFLS